MNQRDCFYNKEAPGLPSHPWIILSKPEIDPDHIVIVNLTDAENYDDDSCVLEIADHPKVIKKRSCIAYRKAIITSDRSLEDMKRSGLIFMKISVSEETLSRILDGIREGGELPNAHRKILREQGLIP